MNKSIWFHTEHNGISGMDGEHHRRHPQQRQQQQQLDNYDYDKTNTKLPIAIKPYWYIDPSIVYRAITSPVNTDAMIMFFFRLKFTI